MVVCILPTSRTHGSRFAVQGSRCCGSALVTACDGFDMFVTGLFPIPSQINSLYISDLTVFVTVVTVVTAFLSSFSHLNALLILSSKSNFDQIIPSQRSQMATARIDADFLSSQSRHKSRHNPVTTPSLPSQIQNHRSLCPLTADHEQRTSIRVTRSSVGLFYVLGNSTIGCLPQ
jgi:hypothetical protein